MADDVLPYYPTQAEVDRIRDDRIEAIRQMIPEGEGAEVNVVAIAKLPASTGILEAAEELQADLRGRRHQRPQHLASRVSRIDRHARALGGAPVRCWSCRVRLPTKSASHP